MRTVAQFLYYIALKRFTTLRDKILTHASSVLPISSGREGLSMPDARRAVSSCLSWSGGGVLKYAPKLSRAHDFLATDLRIEQRLDTPACAFLHAVCIILMLVCIYTCTYVLYLYTMSYHPTPHNLAQLCTIKKKVEFLTLRIFSKLCIC